MKASFSFVPAKLPQRMDWAEARASGRLPSVQETLRVHAHDMAADPEQHNETKS